MVVFLSSGKFVKMVFLDFRECVEIVFFCSREVSGYDFHKVIRVNEDIVIVLKMVFVWLVIVL